MFCAFRTDSLCKMKFSFIFVLYLLKSSETSAFECGHSTDGMKSVEFYCTNFKGLVPVNCSTTFSYMNIVKKSKVIELKLGGCDSDRVKQLVEEFPNLRLLDLSHSGITSLDSFDLKHEHLQKVNVSHNQISELPLKFFTKIPDLIRIDVSYNKLSKNLVKLPNKLAWIDLSHNEIRSLNGEEFAHLDKLEYLDMSHNMISDVDYYYLFSNNSQLNTLRLENNQIKDFDYRYLTLVTRGVSVMISWKHITKFTIHENLTKEIQIVLNSEKEGFLMGTNGKIEMHCNERSFKRINKFEVTANHIENPTELMHCLSSSLKFFELSGKFTQKLKSKSLERFTNLQDLPLSNIQLEEFDISALKDYKELFYLDISKNNLRHIKNTCFLHDLKDLIVLNVADNQLENVTELIQHVNPSILRLYLSGNYLGRINEITFDKFAYLSRLHLSNTSLTFDDLKPFESFKGLEELNISHNNLETSNFSSSSSKVFKKMWTFSAANCRIQNASQLLHLFGPHLWHLDLSGNFLGEINGNSFDGFKNLYHVNLSSTGLLSVDFKTFKHKTKLQLLDLSNNNLKNVNFTVPSKLTELHLNGNEIKELINFNKLSLSRLTKLAISNNHFSCQYLKKFIPHLMREWPNLEFIGNPWHQKHGKCHHKEQNTI